MRYTNVRLAACTHLLPERVVTSRELEDQLAPVYARFGMHAGRLELMTGIRERRFFEPGTRPSTVAAAVGARALEQSGVDRGRLGMLIHASVCRDFLEPATASLVHCTLELPATCTAFDLSNACLGVANGMTVVAGAIERGEIDAGLVVACEDGRALVASTIAALRERSELTKAELKLAFASLTIGSGAAAVLLARGELTPAAPKLAGAVSMAATEHHALCSGDRDAAWGGPLMQTDSEAMLHAGGDLAGRTWDLFRAELDWETAEVDRVVTHQVGVAHRRLLTETLGIDPAIDFPTVEHLGNIGSVSLPLCLSMAREQGAIGNGQRVALLGIGSGLHCLMLGVET